MHVTYTLHAGNVHLLYTFYTPYIHIVYPYILGVYNVYIRRI